MQRTVLFCALCAGSLAAPEAHAQVPAEAPPPAPAPAERSAPPPEPAPASAPAEGAAAPVPPPAAEPAKNPPVDVSDVEAAFNEQPSAARPAPSGGAVSGVMNPDLSLVLEVAGAYFSNPDHLETGAHDPKRRGFNLQQLELAAGAAVDPYLRFDANIVFGLEEVEIEEAYATTLDLPFGFQARFGQFLTRFGRINPTHPHAWDFVDQPFAIGRVFGGEGNRGLGVELSWLAPLPWAVELVASAMNSDGEGSMRSFYGARDLGVDGLGDFTYMTALKQFFPLSHDWSLAFGLSGEFGPNSTGRSNRTDVYGTDIYLKYRPITRQSSMTLALQSEWLYRRREVPDDLLQDVNEYTQLVWLFSKRWGAAIRQEYGSPSYGLDGEPSPNDPLDPPWVEARHRLSGNVSFWPSEFSRFRLQAARDMPGYRDAMWSVFLSAEVVTGAHGAHAF